MEPVCSDYCWVMDTCGVSGCTQDLMSCQASDRFCPLEGRCCVDINSSLSPPSYSVANFTQINIASGWQVKAGNSVSATVYDIIINLTKQFVLQYYVNCSSVTIHLDNLL